MHGCEHLEAKIMLCWSVDRPVSAQARRQLRYGILWNEVGLLDMNRLVCDEMTAHCYARDI